MAVSSRKALGIDFGGTAVKLAVVRDDGQIERQVSFATAETQGVAGWINRVAGSLAQLGLPSDAEELCTAIEGIGVGVPGFTDYSRGFVYALPNVPGWQSVPLADLMRQRFGARVVVDNDVNAMTAGECAFGAGRRFRHAVFVTLGTGVGGGLLIDGKIYRGAHSLAGEIGHVSIDMNGVRSPQGLGGLENYVGNRAIVDRAIMRMREGVPSMLQKRFAHCPDRLTPRDIAEAAATGDALGLEVFDFVARCLATAFASITYLLQPEAFIIGGGVAQAGDVLFGPLRRHLKDRLSPIFSERLEIHPAALGASAGVIGCASLALGLWKDD